MIRTAGRLIVAIAAIHFLFGLVAYFGPLSAAAREGFWNSVDPHDDRQEAFWFVVFAFPLLFLGQLLAARPETSSRSTLAFDFRLRRSLCDRQPRVYKPGPSSRLLTLSAADLRRKPHCR